MKTRLALLFVTLAAASSAHTATDAYRQWAVSKWGVTIASSDTARTTTWGETADPDRDGIPNLVEYQADTNPTARTPLSDVYTYSVPDSGSPSSRFPQLLAWLRTDDPDLRVICQTSSDPSFWQPAAPADLSQPQPANPWIAQQDTGLVSRGLRQVRFTDLQPIANRAGAFMRLLVIRRDQIAAGPGIDPISFTSQLSVPVGTTARSNTIVLSGFTGTITINIPSGITLFVNGIAQTGSTATVKAGDHLWMQATAPGTAGVPRNYTLTIGGQSATWTFTTTAIAAVPDHPGTDSGYTPVETGVSDTGAAQISIPIVVSPGPAGMHPKLSINYSSQGGNGPLGVGFSLSGLSTISRVGRTVAQDGIKGGVNFDANDRFALDTARRDSAFSLREAKPQSLSAAKDNQHLIDIIGADGADGTEYRLEFDPA